MLLLLVVPQIVLYGLIAVAIAAQNARHHFSLAAAAPAIENIGLIVTLVICALMYGTGTDINNVSNSYLTVLGIGATLAVAAHAGVQCWGAWRAGLPLVPGWNWHDPEIRAVRRRMVPTIGTASLDAAWTFILIVAAGTIPGGVVAFQIGLNFYNLPLAAERQGGRNGVVATYGPRLRAVGPRRVPRHVRPGHGVVVVHRSTGERGPCAVRETDRARACFRRDEGWRRGRAHYRISRGARLRPHRRREPRIRRWQACYARHDVKAPFISGVVLVAITLVGAPIAVIAFSGPAALAALGVVVVVGETARVFICDIAARHELPNLHTHPVRTLIRDSIISLIALAPAALAARAVTTFGNSRMFMILEVTAGVGVGLIVYLAIQGLLGAPEMPERVRRGSSSLTPTEVAP